MGITGLLPFLDPATRNCNIAEFRGATVAIDSYCWLHRGATACADVLARGEETDVYVNFCMKYVNMLRKYDIKPILVFDGNHLPAKALTEKRRRETRKNAKVRAAELLRLGKKDEAWNFFRQAVDITPKMAFNLIKECRNNQIDCIVAPYESDSQLAYLNLKGIADLVITEDSDLVLFGCTKVFFKMDINGNGRLVEKEKIPLCMKMKPDQYTFDKFRYMCILSGCDYLDSLPGVGLKKALKFVSLTAETNPAKFLEKVPRYLNLKNKEVTEEYKESFLVADATFKHQIVYDPLERKLKHLTDPSISGTRPEHCKNAGEFFDNDMAYQVAIGNLNPFSFETLDDWSPKKDWNNSFHSIWSNSFVKKVSMKDKKLLDKIAYNELKERKEQEEIMFENHRKLSDETCEVGSEPWLNLYKTEVKEKENDENCDNKSPTNKENIAITEEKSPEKQSPVLKKKFSNPFLKKRLSKFGTTEIQNDVIVKSKYFHSKAEDLSTKDIHDVSLTNIEVEEVSTENKESDENDKKRKVELCEKDETISETSSGTEVKPAEREPKIFFSQEYSSSAKKPKLTRCRSVGLPVKSQKKQLTLQVLFANINSKKT